MKKARFSLLGSACALTLCGFALGACAPSYSPNTYSSNAVQLANKVDSGVIVGYREVKIASNGTVGAVTGGAAGGLLGGEYADSAIAAIGGSAVGAVVGSKLDHAVNDTTGWEYIIRKANGDMLSVTQREPQPIPIGQRVLVINGPQARVVPDYSVAADQPPPKDKADNKTDSKPAPPVKVEVVLSLPPGVSAQTAPVGGASAPAAQPAAPATTSPAAAATAQPAVTAVASPAPTAAATAHDAVATGAAIGATPVAAVETTGSPAPASTSAPKEGTSSAATSPSDPADNASSGPVAPKSAAAP